MRLIFDLDGTLIDSAPDLNAAANRMLAELFSAPPVPLETFATFIGNGIPAQVERTLAHAGVAADDETRGRAIAAFKRHYGAAPAEKTIVFGGVREALAEMKEAGARMAVCTNKSEDLAWLALEGLGLAGFFGALVGGETLAVKKPDPAPLHECARRLGEDAGPVFYVGDSETDEAAALAAGYPLLLYTEGYRKKPVEDFAAAGVFSHFGELPGLIGKLV